MSLSPRVRALFFDLDDTLIDRSGAYDRYLADFMARHAHAFPAGRRDLDARSLWLLDVAAANDRPTYCRNVAALFPQLGLDAEGVWQDYAARIGNFVAPRPSLEPLLDQLASRYRLGIVTNGNPTTQHAKLASSGLGRYFGEVIVSGDVGADKPEPLIFERALGWAGCDPAEAIFVGDDPLRDVAGASRLGMRTVWVADAWRARSRGAYPSDLPQPTWILERTERLLEVVEPLRG